MVQHTLVCPRRDQIVSDHPGGDLCRKFRKLCASMEYRRWECQRNLTVISFKSALTHVLTHNIDAGLYQARLWAHRVTGTVLRDGLHWVQMKQRIKCNPTAENKTEVGKGYCAFVYPDALNDLVHKTKLSMQFLLDVFKTNLKTELFKESIFLYQLYSITSFLSRFPLIHFIL